MRTLVRHLQIRPHDDRLRAPSAAFWFFSATCLIFPMAFTELIAWGYLALYFAEGNFRWVVAAFTGITIFVVVWMIDVSLITMDRAWGEHAEAILGKPPASATWRRIREAFTFLLRISLLAGSLTITAPYLAQVVFHKDIERQIASDAGRIIEAGRSAVAAKSDSLIRQKDAEIAVKRSEFEHEVAGKGTSGRYGLGPAALALGQTVSTLEEERGALQSDKDTSLNEFDTLARDWRINREKLAALYGLSLPQTSILENRKALEILQKRPEYQSTELAIKAFLCFIFTGLLLLKLFEPHSVRLYLSDVLQQEYQRYLAGAFDEVLPAIEKSTSRLAAMSAQRLYDFLVNVWAPARRVEERQTETRARGAAAKQSLDTLEDLQKKIDQEVRSARDEVQRVCAAADDASQSLNELRSAITAVTDDLTAFRAERASLGSDTTMDARSRLEYRTILDSRIGEAERALQSYNDAMPVETEKFHRASAALKLVEARLQAKESELEATQKTIREVRSMLSTAVGDGARSVLGVARH
jgi:hypothetical protein